jgi:hypothetical protein
METAFRLTWFFSLIYSKRLSNQFGEDYTIHPQMYDGIFGPTKIINNNIFNQKSLLQVLSKSIEKTKENIWSL